MLFIKFKQMKSNFLKHLFAPFIKNNGGEEIKLVVVDGITYNIEKGTKTASVIAGELKYSGSVVIPSNFKSNSTIYKVKSVEEQAFYGCTQLTNVVIPNSVTSIGSRAFIMMYLEAQNNQEQPEITKYKPLIINVF